MYIGPSYRIIFLDPWEQFHKFWGQQILDIDCLQRLEEKCTPCILDANKIFKKLKRN